MVIEVDVSNKIASLVDKSIVGVCGNSDYVIRFNFDDEWAAYETKTARFKYNGSYADVIFTGTDCPMPIVQNTYNVEIGVYAGDLHTTTSAYLPMRKSILCGSGSPADPEPDVYNQLMDKLNNLDVKGYEELSGEMGNLDNLKTDAKDNLVEAINEAAVIPDYNQNDETAPDYIKNRPCYDTRTEETETVFSYEIASVTADGLIKVDISDFDYSKVNIMYYSCEYDGELINDTFYPTVTDESANYNLPDGSIVRLNDNEIDLMDYYASAEAIAAVSAAVEEPGWYAHEYAGDTNVKVVGVYTWINGELKTIGGEYLSGFTQIKAVDENENLVNHIFVKPNRKNDGGYAYSESEIVYDVDSSRLRLCSEFSPYCGLIHISQVNATLSLSVGNSKSITVTDEENIKILEQIGPNFRNARIHIQFSQAYLECWLFDAYMPYPNSGASGMCYASDGNVYGILASWRENATSATITIKRLI